MITHVSFLGLGSMGEPMAFNLLRNRIQLSVYNRSKEKATPLLKEGASLLLSPDEAFEKSPVACSMVANDKALQELSRAILKNAKHGCIHVSMSTVSPALSRELAKQHAEKGVHFIAAPVFGRPEAAKEAKLWICISGQSEAKPQVEPLLHYMGQKIYDFGTDPGAANVVKVTGNFLILSTIEMIAEAYANAEKNGIDLETLHAFFTSSMFTHQPFKTYGKIVMDKNFKAGFKMELALKDLNLFTDISTGLDLPMRDIVRERLEDGVENKRADLDWSAISIASRE